MADEVDAAQEAEERLLQAARAHREPEVKATGLCAWCNERISQQRVFCDEHCSSDFHWAHKLRKLSGR